MSSPKMGLTKGSAFGVASAEDAGGPAEGVGWATAMLIGARSSTSAAIRLGMNLENMKLAS
jgi:hypothetical protein